MICLAQAMTTQVEMAPQRSISTLQAVRLFLAMNEAVTVHSNSLCKR